MKFCLEKFSFVVALLFASLFWACEKEEEFVDIPVSSKFDQVFYTTIGNVLYAFNTNAVKTPLSKVNVTGLSANEHILSIDFRPATGQLYALTDFSRIYTLDIQSGVARGITTSAFTPALNSAGAGMNFDPTTDLIHIVTDRGQNLTVDPTTGVATVQPNITTNISAIAYNSNTAGATSTVMYALDPIAGKLYGQQRNSSSMQEIGNLGITLSKASFDINAAGNQAVVIGRSGDKSFMYEINLANGKATLTGKFAYQYAVTSIAIPTDGAAYAMSGTDFITFNLAQSTYISKPAVGLQSSETIVAMDMRPATGQLYAIGSSNRIYRVNMASGTFSQVAVLTTALSGQSYGMDFNPVTDAMNVVSNTGQNLTITPVGVVTVNPAIAGTATFSALANSNNVASASTSTTFAISDNADALYTFVPATGLSTLVGNLGLDINGTNGFDIVSAGTINLGIGVFNVGGKTGLYTIDLGSGLLSKRGDFNFSVNAFAVGLRL